VASQVRKKEGPPSCVGSVGASIFVKDVLEEESGGFEKKPEVGNCKSRDGPANLKGNMKGICQVTKRGKRTKKKEVFICWRKKMNARSTKITATSRAKGNRHRGRLERRKKKKEPNALRRSPRSEKGRKESF